jgi:hypothetical protein
LRWFLPEDVMPKDLLQHEVRRWLTELTTAVWALLDDEAAEAIGVTSSVVTIGTPATRS